MQLLQTYTFANSSSNTIVMNTIPSTYKHLRIITSCRSTYASTFVEVTMKINSSSNSYSRIYLTNLNGTLTSGGDVPGNTPYQNLQYTAAANMTANSFTNYDIYITGYSNSSYKKSMSSWGYSPNMVATGSGAGVPVQYAGGFDSTGAISTLEFSTENGNFATGSIISIYGIN